MTEKPSNILKTPEGVTNLGPIQDMALTQKRSSPFLKS